MSNLYAPLKIVQSKKLKSKQPFHREYSRSRLTRETVQCREHAQFDLNLSPLLLTMGVYYSRKGGNRSFSNLPEHIILIHV